MLLKISCKIILDLNNSQIMSDWKTKLAKANVRPFDPYKVIPSLEPYRYPHSCYRMYRAAILRQTVRPCRETGPLIHEPHHHREDDIYIHNYIAHVCPAKTMFKYNKRMLSDLEYGTHFLTTRKDFIFHI